MIRCPICLFDCKPQFFSGSYGGDTKPMKEFKCFFKHYKVIPHSYTIRLRPNPDGPAYHSLFEDFCYYDNFNLIGQVRRYYRIYESVYKEEIDYDCIQLPPPSYRMVALKDGLFDPKNPDEMIKLYKKYTLFL